MPTVVYDHHIFSLQQYGGISRYVCEVATRMGLRDGWRSQIVAPFHFNDHLAASPAAKIGVHLRMRVPRTGRLYRAANALVGPALVRSCAPDVVHRTYYAPAPRPRRGRLVITVHDMIHELFPQLFPAGDRTAADKRHSVRIADHVICVSHNTAADLARLLGVPRERISVTHLGFSDAFRHTAAPSPEKSRAGRPYLLYVGHRAGYKNFARLLDAYAASARLRADFDIVAFGGFPLNADERARIASLGLRPDAVRHKAGSDAALAAAYADARALVYPSEYEGFGIPPLEAMSCGCPVVCSSTSSIPEVVGEAGVYFDPKDMDAMRVAIEQLVYDDGLRQSMIAAGTVRRERFSWDRCTQETAAAYQAALGAP